MRTSAFRVLYREFLFRIVDLELLSPHAAGDSRTLLGQFAAVLIFVSLVLAAAAGLWAAHFSGLAPLLRVIGSWTAEHFLIATTMLAVGLFAVLSWESTFPDRRDVLVLGPLPVRARTILLAKVAAVATALGVTLVALHAAAGIAWPFALASFDSTPAPALLFDPPRPPLRAADFPAVLNRDMRPLLARLDLAAADGGAGIVIGVSEHGARRVMAYGAAHRDSLFEIGSITKTFTGLILARMAAEGKLDLHDPAIDLLPGAGRSGGGPPVTLLDLATHRSGLPAMPDNAGSPQRAEAYTEYHAAGLDDYIARHGLVRPEHPTFQYSNLGFAVLGAALAARARLPYEELLRREVLAPLGLKDTTITLDPEQAARLLPGYNAPDHRTPHWDLDAFAPAGGIRSTADDLLTYLEAQLHPDRTPFPAAIRASQKLRDRVGGNSFVAMDWIYNGDAGDYEHDGATGGFTSAAFFDPRRDFAGVVLVNVDHMTFPFSTVLGEHVRERLAGEPALSLSPVAVPPAGPIRSFFAYWITMLAAGTFVFCAVLALPGLAVQILPRPWFLRTSAVLQLAVLTLLVCGYFLQRSPVSVLVSGPRKAWIPWVPSYWFVGLYQQLSGSLHPALAGFAARAWVGLAVAAAAAALAYGASYRRTLRQIVEQPDVAPGIRHTWLPRFGRAFETAIVQFSVRSLLRSRQHRMILAFYLGLASAFGLLLLNVPPELSGPTQGDQWHRPSVPMLASTICLMIFWVAGTRVAFSLPLDLRANWIFRTLPFAAGPRCLRARRRALLVLSVVPAWTISAVAVLSLWPWGLAAAHLAGLACLGVFLAEISFRGVQKIPFACSYLPGKSQVHVAFVLWIYLLLSGVLGAAIWEVDALERPASTAAMLAILGAAALFAALRNDWQARPAMAELRYDEEPPDRLVNLDLD
jgi:CubicO group peptidase (beta-lactamase class C family)